MTMFVSVLEFPMFGFIVPHALDYFTHPSHLFELVPRVACLFVDYLLKFVGAESFEKPTPANAGL
jgi:hypothetical protein